MPSCAKAFIGWTRQDWQANARSREGRLVLVWFRTAQWALAHWGWPGRKYAAFYSIYTSLFFSVELPPSMTVGPRLKLFHPHGVVLHPRAKLGADCILRQGVTIGTTLRQDGFQTEAPIVGDNVEFGAHAVAIGPIFIGSDARIGASAVVLKDVPPNRVAVGNPARVLPPQADS